MEDQAVEIIDVMGDIVRAARADTAARSRQDGVSAAVLGLLAHLSREGGAQRLGHLAARSGVGAPTASRHVALAQEQGLVVRTPDPDDGRACLLELSPRGEQALARHRAGQVTDTRRALQGWSEQEVDDLLRLLRRLRTDAVGDAHPPSTTPERPTPRRTA